MTFGDLPNHLCCVGKEFGEMPDYSIRGLMSVMFLLGLALVHWREMLLPIFFAMILVCIGLAFSSLARESQDRFGDSRDSDSS